MGSGGRVSQWDPPEDGVSEILIGNCPLLPACAQRAAVPPHLTSQSSGCAPISSIRSFESVIGPVPSSRSIQPAPPKTP